MQFHARTLLFIGCILMLAGSYSASAQETRGGWLGIEVRNVTQAEAERMGWDAPRGAMVTGTPARNSPAEKAGIKAGDVIVAVERTLIDTAEEFNLAMVDKQPGTEVRFQVISGGKERRVVATLAARPTTTAGKADRPELMLDTGGHMGVIKGLIFTPDGKQIISAGEDKVIRIWDWESGKIKRTIRGQVGPGDEGKVIAMVLSPNGKILAAAGFMGALDSGPAVGTIRLFDFESGKLIALLPNGHRDIVTALAFSPDGKRLVSGSSDKNAVVWDVERATRLFTLSGHTDWIYGVAFTPDGQRIVTASDDTTLRLWKATDGTLIRDMRGHKKEIFRALAIRRSDSLIASGDSTGEIRLWDGVTGEFLRTLGSQNSVVGILAFSPDGSRLLSTCAGGVPCSQIIWDVASGARLQQASFHDNIVIAGIISPDGRLVTTGGGTDMRIQVWDLFTGSSRRLLVGKGTSKMAAGFSGDGRLIAWGNTPRFVSNHDRGPLEMQLRLPGAGVPLGRPETLPMDAVTKFVRSRPVLGSYALSHRQGGRYGDVAGILDVKKDGQLVTSIVKQQSDGSRHLSYSLTLDGQAIISGGGNGVLMAYDLTGKPLGEFVGHESDVWAVAPAAQGTLLVSASSDQTVRLWNIKTRELIATLFHGTDGEWVMWTPQGYYMSSPGADKIVGWQINKGQENAADYVGADQLRVHLNRPDIVERAIILASATKAVEEARATFKLADLLKSPVPRFRVLSPTSGSSQKGGRVTVKVDIEQVPDPIKAIRVHVNGRQVSEVTPETGAGGLKGVQELDVPLSKGRNEVRITMTNRVGDRTEALTLMHDSEGDLDKRGTLYLLAIGVQRYPGLGKTCGPNGDASCDLRFAVADALKLADAIESRLGPAHNQVVKRVLVNGRSDKESPTVGNILDAIDILKDATETDTVIIFIAGHGVNDGSNFRFLATNAERLGSSYRGQTVVAWEQLQSAIESAKGRRILFLDTCHSGSAAPGQSFNRRIDNAAYHANIITYTAARFDQEALEDSLLGHGLFTYAVVEGLDGKGQAGSRREISTKALHDYVKQRVDQLAKSIKGEQEPQYFMGRDAEDYVLARW